MAQFITGKSLTTNIAVSWSPRSAQRVDGDEMLRPSLFGLRDALVPHGHLYDSASAANLNGNDP